MKAKHLAMQLSSLKPHPQFQVQLEQYQTEGALVSRWLTEIAHRVQISSLRVADLGCGNGVLGIGMLLLGAEHVHFVETDQKAIDVLQDNLKDVPMELYTIHNIHIDDSYIIPDDTSFAISNPPWGVQTSKADRPFLTSMFASNCEHMSLLHASSATHINTMAQRYQWQSIKLFNDHFRLPAQYQHHTQRQSSTPISCWIFSKIRDA